MISTYLCQPCRVARGHEVPAMKWTIFDTLAAIVVGAIAGVLVGYVLMVAGAFLLYEVAR